MGFSKNVKKLPSPDELIAAYPLTAEAAGRVEKNRREVRDILTGRDQRLMVVVGPCSAWPEKAVIDYAHRLKELSEEVKDTLKLVLRVYIQKPRTSKGWTGPVNQPDPLSAPDIQAGMAYCRRMMVRAIEMGLPIADEALFTHNARGFVELLSWVAIGARSSEDQEHRIWASAIGVPVGMKNPTSGSIRIGVNSVQAAQSPHTAVFDGYQVETVGNQFAHLVLRGGASGPNYSLHDLYRSWRLMQERGVKNPAILVDASHDNCRINGEKNPGVQVDVVREVLNNLKVHEDLRGIVRGFMLESFLKEGSQTITGIHSGEIDRSGLSITDPCMGWDRTRALLLDMAAELETLAPWKGLRMTS